MLVDPGPSCMEDADCDDGLFCNGTEVCGFGECLGGTPPCPAAEQCESCDEQADACKPFCTDHADCDDGLFCNGVEFCDGCECIVGQAPCPSFDNCEVCDEANDSCALPCGDDTDCDDGDFCTADQCDGCNCFNRSRKCEGGLSCQPATGLCVDAEGVDVCASRYGDCDPAAMAGYEETLHSDFGLTGCGGDTPDGWQVGGTCAEGTLFVSVSNGLHGEVRYFDAATGVFLAWIFLSDAIDCQCFGVYYCPTFIECQGAVVTEVVCGARFSPGGAIALPEKLIWYDHEFWESCTACGEHADCDDGLFCNGWEQCDHGVCVAGIPVICPQPYPCDEATDSCAEPVCESHLDCDDGVFCNGAETCKEGACRAGDNPCGLPFNGCDPCVEDGDLCVLFCTADADCDDGDPCTSDACIGCNGCANLPVEPCLP